MSPHRSFGLCVALALGCTSAAAQSPNQQLVKMSQQLATEWGAVYQLNQNCHEPQPALEPTNAVSFFGRYLPPENTRTVLDSFSKGSAPLRGAPCSTSDLTDGMAGFQRDVSSYQVFAAPFQH